jgi:pimeloyl-ACP methyl ester carboxylesterase
MFLQSHDNCRIYYDSTGSGPAIVLLHGFGDSHTSWEQAGWVDCLKKSYTVITMDFRGCGESDKPHDSNAYSIEHHCSDIDGVLAAVNARHPIIWGWSLGATVAMHYASGRPVRAMIACGSYFGMVFSDAFVEKQLRGMSDAADTARLKAFNKWPIVFPEEIKNPFFVYTGTNDGNVVIQLKKQRKAIEAARGTLMVFDGVDHFGLIRKSDGIEKAVMEFLRGNSSIRY